jgi:hypothetical protein
MLCFIRNFNNVCNFVGDLPHDLVTGLTKKQYTTSTAYTTVTYFDTHTSNVNVTEKTKRMKRYYNILEQQTNPASTKT